MPTGSEYARVDCFPAHAAFPKWQEGRHPHCHFRDAMGQTAARLYHRHLRQYVDGASHVTTQRLKQVPHFPGARQRDHCGNRDSHPVDENKFMLGPVKRSHPGIRLVPDAEVQALAVDGRADGRNVSMCRQSMQTKWTAPSREQRAAAPSVSERKERNSASLISEAMANSRWLPVATACPPIRTL
jgi:hypothetical protein